MNQTIITFDSPEQGDAVQLKLFEGGFKWNGNRVGTIAFNYAAGGIHTWNDKTLTHGANLVRDWPALTVVPASDFLANPRLVPGWDDGKQEYPDKFILICRTQEESVLMKKRWPKRPIYEFPYCYRIAENNFIAGGVLNGYIEYKDLDYSEYIFVEACDYFGLTTKTSSPCGEEKQIEETPILKGNTMLYEVAVVEKASGDKTERIVQDIVSVTATSTKGAEFQALAMIDLKTVDSERLEVLVRPFLKQ